MSHLSCILCGLQKPLSAQNLEDNDLDIYLITKRGLGRGKGYYDRYIYSTRSLRIGLYIAGICTEMQVLKKVPVDKWDEKVDYLITEKRFVNKV